MFKLYNDFDFTNYKLIKKMSRATSYFNMSLYNLDKSYILFIIYKNKKIIIESDNNEALEYYYSKLETVDRKYDTTERLHDIMITIYKINLDGQTKEKI